jgi:hemolysin activation/secretion protein
LFGISSLIRGTGIAAALLLIATVSFAQTRNERFDINRFLIEGNALLKADEIETALTPFTGKQRSDGDVRQAIEALRQRYSRAGFSVKGVIASEQDFARGLVTLQVVEIQPAKATAQAESHADDAGIRPAFPVLAAKVSPDSAGISPKVQIALNDAAILADTAARRFAINRYLIKGNSPVSVEEIDRVLKPYTGKQRDDNDVQRAVEALKRRYDSAGYDVRGVIASEQDFDRGIVTLQLLEPIVAKRTGSGKRDAELAKVTPENLALLGSVSAKVPAKAPEVPAVDHVGITNPNRLEQTISPQFNIDRYRIEGNTTIKVEEIDTLLKPFTGKQREYADVQHAMDALRLRYRDAGYSAVQVVSPEQELDRGVVLLKVVEGKIGKVTIEGNRFFDETNIRSSLPALKENVSPKAADISANVQLANENPAKQVDVIMRTGKEAGVVDATVAVIDVAPLKAFLTLDNTGNPQTGDLRVGVGVQHANLFNHDDVGTLNYVTSPGKEHQVSLVSGSYRMPLYSAGDAIDVIVARSDVSNGSVETVAGLLSLSGKGTFYGLRYNQLLPRHGEYTHRIVYGLDYRIQENDCALGSFGAAGCASAGADITTRPISLTYSGNWAKPGWISDFTISLTRNLPGVAHGQDSDFQEARPSPTGGEGAPSRYTVVRAGASMVKAFENNWQVRGAVNAQYTPDALIASEQLSISGANAVRGFLEREVIRDTGYYANFELYSPNLSGKGDFAAHNLRGLLFFDFARAANNPLPGEAKQPVSIASIGAGFRWTVERDFNMRFDLARVVDDGATGRLAHFRGHISAYFGM